MELPVNGTFGIPVVGSVWGLEKFVFFLVEGG